MTTEHLQRSAHSLQSDLASATGVPSDNEVHYAWVVEPFAACIPRRAYGPEHCAPLDAFSDAFFSGSPIAVLAQTRDGVSSIPSGAGWRPCSRRSRPT